MNCKFCHKKMLFPLNDHTCFKCLSSHSDKKSCDIIMNNKLYVNTIPKNKIRKHHKTPIEPKWENGTNNELKPCKDYDVGLICNKRSGIIGVDLDFYSKKGKSVYDPINDPYHKLFIDTFGDNFIERFNTYTQKTLNGGFHLIFKHKEGFLQTQGIINDLYKIDTRGGNTNGYVKQYQCINDTDIKEIPDDLFNFIKTNIFDKTSQKKKYVKKINNNLCNKLIKYQTKYTYNVPDKKVIEILESLSEDYYLDIGKWFKLTTAMKQIKKKSLWDTYSKKNGRDKYNKVKNFKTWDSIEITNDTFLFEHILKVIKKSRDIRFYRFLQVPKNTFNDFQHINIDKLSKTLKLESNTSYCLKSDTGTGKTTLFKTFIQDTQCEFISIVSRRSLAREQYNDLLEICEGEMSYYEIDTCNKMGQGITICIDSILKLQFNMWDFKNKVIFLDEFNSIIEYLLDTDTLAKNRDSIFEYLINEVLLECKAIICVDADISDLSIQFIKEIERIKGIKFNYIQNDYIHNKGTLSTEHHEHEDFIYTASKEELFLMPCDSKKQAKNIWQQLTDIDKEHYPHREPIILIVAEGSEKVNHIKLNEHKRVIFSPKIVYGLDSDGYGVDKLPRPVFSYYEMNTISPSAMLQQINRERRITHHYYFIFNKKVSTDTIISEDNFKLYVEEENLLSLKVFNSHDKHINQLFCSLLYYYEYKQNCYKSNSALHFKMLLQERGFKLTNDDCFCGDRGNQLKTNKKENVIKYDSENYTLKDLLEHNVNRKVLHIYNTEDVKKYSHIINDNFAISQHLNIKYLLLQNSNEDEIKLKKRLESNNDFTIKKLKSSINQIIFTKKVLNTFNMNSDLTINGSSNCDTTQILKEYQVLFRDRTTKPIELNTDYDKIKFVASKLYHKLHIPMKNTSKKTNGVKLMSYHLNMDEVETHTQIMSYSTKHFSKTKQLDDYLTTINNDFQLNYLDVKCELLGQ